MTGKKKAKSTWGGKRVGIKAPAHRPLKYGEATKKIATLVPESKVEEFRKMIAAWLKQWEVSR